MEERIETSPSSSAGGFAVDEAFESVLEFLGFFVFALQVLEDFFSGTLEDFAEKSFLAAA